MGYVASRPRPLARVRVPRPVLCEWRRGITESFDTGFTKTKQRSRLLGKKGAVRCALLLGRKPSSMMDLDVLLGSSKDAEVMPISSPASVVPRVNALLSGIAPSEAELFSMASTNRHGPETAGQVLSGHDALLQASTSI